MKVPVLPELNVTHRRFTKHTPKPKRKRRQSAKTVNSITPATTFIIDDRDNEDEAVIVDEQKQLVKDESRDSGGGSFEEEDNKDAMSMSCSDLGLQLEIDPTVASSITRSSTRGRLFT